MIKLDIDKNPPQEQFVFCRLIPNGEATVSDAVQYAREVVERKRKAAQWIIKACERFLNDLIRCDDPDDDLEFSIERANHVLHFFQTYLVHVKASVKVKAGDPVDLMDWHIFILVNLFGFIKPLRDDETGQIIQDEEYDEETDSYFMRDVYIRRFSTALILVGRKNAKSFLATGIGLYMMCFDGEGGSEVYSAATKRDQARIVFDDAKQMVEKSSELKEIIKTAKLSIYHVESYSKFVPLASEADSLDGLNIHCGILDEIHAMKTRDLYDVIETATGSRRQPLILAISTAGVILNGICAELRDYGKGILNLASKNVGDSFFFLFYTLDTEYEKKEDNDNEYDESVWYKANPGLGASKALKTMREQAEKAKQAVDARANFMTKHCNIFVSGASAWMDMLRWAQLKNAKPINIPYWLGVDLSNKIDLCAAVKVYYVMDGPAKDHAVIRAKFWIPEGRLKTCSKAQAELYRSFHERGLLKFTDGDVIDHKEIEEDISAWIEEDKEYFQEMAYDPWQATQFALAMQGRGYQIVEVSQTVKNLNEAMVKFQEMTFAGKLHHDHNLVYDWMLSNVQVKPDKNNNIFPDKSSLENKIDGPAATFNAISRIVRYMTDAIIPEADPNEWGAL